MQSPAEDSHGPASRLVLSGLALPSRRAARAATPGRAPAHGGGGPPRAAQRRADQHRAFFAVPFLVLGTVDGEGRPWASQRAGLSLDPRRAHAARRRRSAPISARAAISARSASISPRAGATAPTGSCARSAPRASTLLASSPSAIARNTSSRAIGASPRRTRLRPGAVRRGRWLGAAERALVAGADSFFIVSALGSVRGALSCGVDVSHRGGPPGFVRVDDEHTLSVPDFVGNSYYNTLGNFCSTRASACSSSISRAAASCRSPPRPRPSGTARKWCALPARSACCVSMSRSASPPSAPRRCAGASATILALSRLPRLLDGGAGQGVIRRRGVIVLSSSCRTIS